MIFLITLKIFICVVVGGIIAELILRIPFKSRQVLHKHKCPACNGIGKVYDSNRRTIICGYCNGSKKVKQICKSNFEYTIHHPMCNYFLYKQSECNMCKKLFELYPYDNVVDLLKTL